MRKPTAILLAAVFLFTLAGCGSKNAVTASVDLSDLPNMRYIGEFALDWVKAGPRQKAAADSMQFSSIGGSMEGKKLTASVEVNPSISLKSVEFSLIKAALSLEYTDTSVELYGASKTIKAGQSIQFFYSIVYKVYEATMQDAQRTRYICKVPGEEAMTWGYQLFDGDGNMIQDTTIDSRARESNPQIPKEARQFCDASGYHYYMRYGVDSKDFWEALDYCEKYGGHLVSIDSEKENDFVFNAFCKGKTTYDPPYIGVWRERGNWSNELAEYKNWDGGKPSNITDESCGAFSNKFNGKWDNVENYTSGAFICEWDVPFEAVQNKQG